MATEKAAAVLTIKNADKMTTEGRRQIAIWLTKQAAFLVDHGDEYAGRFRARYLYEDIA